MSLQSNWFPPAVPGKPSGHYAHLIVLRETTSYAVFQTDGELNTARVSSGLANTSVMTRLALFKRKQTTPERLTGRELLRRYSFLSDQPYDEKAKLAMDSNDRLICDYNVHFCNQCPDCITYGFAIGDAGSEKSKVITDTAYSLTDYASSHETFTLNAPYESGTMSREGQVTSRINELDHVKPQVLFPTVVTVRDVTHSLFEYTLNNLIRTRHYGAQTTRTGGVANHILAIVLTDGEVFSNLKFCQALYDVAREHFQPPDPVDTALARSLAAQLVPNLLQADGVAINQLLQGDELTTYLADFMERTSNERAMQELLSAAFADSRRYYEAYIASSKK
ncbi:MAG: type I-D CRISPR-associated protein Cas7/Csc2 [Chloroflexi bacterium]|nr:type I-D CRISPR-associated protein Cas7/Csc2 [Chloroflexota bacterium]MCI0581071.1 type I-D CRISPR-associated protein Cas7/Csc2 [Chloroflexota bacterium]MCI0649465.1 type I-D CRISPR-associated protein Cas7/Csc2 [Chloroflexota bacterium]MCI0731864.1 type I-D CRISPR-associated protein Cas7/Csc2 [Chloroflexota bacterium]